jgi:hypothetical protein
MLGPRTRSASQRAARAEQPQVHRNGNDDGNDDEREPKRAKKGNPQSCTTRESVILLGTQLHEATIMVLFCLSLELFSLLRLRKMFIACKCTSVV